MCVEIRDQRTAPVAWFATSTSCRVYSSPPRRSDQILTDAASRVVYVLDDAERVLELARAHLRVLARRFGEAVQQAHVEVGAIVRAVLEDVVGHGLGLGDLACVEERRGDGVTSVYAETHRSAGAGRRGRCSTCGPPRRYST